MIRTVRGSASYPRFRLVRGALWDAHADGNGVDLDAPLVRIPLDLRPTFEYGLP